ncbi:hypothetical protein E0H73_33135 [Kribbella pittospori]|uniref:Uncharacterized protein n=1 Tax=Kribbella pittospori TaxID=722689 RepID=A0A4V2M9T1_9ACTN|nr:hypothetical protein [Kribbella pittospori]TCC56522.1 hypothetical protein E0H73_33135 [Kribbella pittospori]
MATQAIPLPDHPHENNQGPQYTRREAVRAGLCTKAEYVIAATYYEYVVRNHRTAGTPPNEWEPQAVVGRQLSAPYERDAHDLLVMRLKNQADPGLDAIDRLCDDIQTTIDAAGKLPEDVSTPETNKVYSGRAAAARVEQLTDRVEADRADGYRHHDRAPAWLRFISHVAPWAEALGFLAFLTYYLNVPIVSPWRDWMGWTFSLILVVYIMLGQTWLVDHAARAHNHAREVQADGQKHQAEISRRHRLGYLLVTAAIAIGITTALIERGLDTLGRAETAVTVVMVMLAITTGLLMPTLAFLGKALDGSKVSRERDALSDDLDADRERYDVLVDEAESDLAVARSLDRELVEKVVPAILRDVQNVVDEAWAPYNFLRLQLGGLSNAPIHNSTATEVELATGSRTRPPLYNGIPGAEPVSLQPVIDRDSQLAALRVRLEELTLRLRQLPPHPWDHSSADRITVLEP